MILTLNNVGRIKKADIKIDGLTVICGNNNTGKSTIGKVLFCIYDSLHDIQKNIIDDKIQSIYNIIEKYYYQYNFLEDEQETYVRNKIREAVEAETITDENIQKLVTLILRISNEEGDPKILDDLLHQIRTIRDLDNTEIVERFLTRRIVTEFDGKLGNVNHTRTKAQVELKIKNQAISFYTLGTHQKITLQKYFNIEKNIIYIDDPFLMDQVNRRRLFFITNTFGHQSKMLSLLVSNRDKKKTVIEEILADKRVENVFNKINEISNGELKVRDGKLYYSQDGLKSDLGISNISAGLKTFIMIKELLMTGYLEENGIMVLDEPEIHLHPEWQIKFAEIIVLLQKAYNLNVILTTHSMDFLSAIRYYSKKYDIESVCNYYLTKLDLVNKNKDYPMASFTNMNNDMEGMYASISDPYLDLYKLITE